MHRRWVWLLGFSKPENDWVNNIQSSLVDGLTVLWCSFLRMSLLDKLPTGLFG